METTPFWLDEARPKVNATSPDRVDVAVIGAGVTGCGCALALARGGLSVRVHGARILSPPTDFPYGERQYNAEATGGHRWTFSQSIADVDPATWGGELG